MLPYYLVFAPIALMGVVAPPRRVYPLVWASTFVVLLVFVGLRHHVGMDWNNYLIMIQRANVGGWAESFRASEPGYATLLWISGQAGWGIYGAYFMGSLIFLAGLFRYARTTPHPWIALTVAMPYLVIVAGMSGARQAVAIGVLLWLVAVWNQSSLIKRGTLVLLATTFHISAAGFLVLVALDMRVRTWVKLIGVTFFGLGVIYILSVSGHGEYYDQNYGRGQTEFTQSAGASLHVALNACPALLAFIFGGRSRNVLLPDSLHRNLAVIAILLLPVSFFASTAAGRLTLYLFPVSMMVVATMPLVVRDARLRPFVRYLFSTFFVTLMAAWLNLANNSRAHQDYQNALFIDGDRLILCCR